MKTLPDNRPQNLDDELAAFSDRVLSGDADIEALTTTATDPELRALEETVLLLQRAMHSGGLSEARARRMQRSVLSRWRENQARGRLRGLNPFGGWRSQQTRRRIGLALSLAVIALLMLALVPSLFGVNTNLSGSAGWEAINAIVLIALIGFVLLAAWFFRRKR